VNHIQNKKPHSALLMRLFVFLSSNFLYFFPYIFKDFVFCPKGNKLNQNKS